MKIQRLKPAGVLVLMFAAIGGCTWVDPIPGASNVSQVLPAHVANCESIGTSISQVKAKVGIINRNDEKVLGELLTLAKNSAVEMGGDTVVAESAPHEGTQKFRIYKCK